MSVDRDDGGRHCPRPSCDH